jgi:tetratricopeptide (TPR) repeat protein
MKKILIIVAILGVLLLGGGYFGYQGYKSIRQTRLVKQARGFIAKSNNRKAILCLQRALRYNSRDPDACRLMAQLSEAARSPASLIWRTKVLEANPHSLEDRLAYVQTALLLRDYASATNGLAAVDPDKRNTASYHNIAGTVASSLGQFPEAEAHFKECIRLEPQNPVPQLNLAVVRLHGTNETALAEARNSLKQIAADVSSNPTNSTLRCQAVRELTVDALHFRQYGPALQLSQQLLEQTNSTFTDRLLRLEILKESHSHDFDPALITYQHEAEVDPGKIYELSMWQMAKISPADTLTWLKSLPSNMQTNQSVNLIEAECYSIAHNWRGLQNWLSITNSSQGWGELEFVRHMFLTRALREQGFDGAAKAEWEHAIKDANGQKASLVMLLRLIAPWRWHTEAEELLWSIVNRYPTEKWATQALGQALFAGGRTRSLMRLYAQEAKTSPSDLSVKNNLAMTALLLDAQELKPHNLARELYQKAPTNSAFASTYAFSLYVQNHNQDALKVFEQLRPKDLENPAIAGYYGLVLKAIGNPSKARSYLDWAFKAPMLPEERNLFEKARAGV